MNSWKEISIAVKRKVIQIAAFGFTNSQLGNYVGGKLYQGPWKQFCNPGLHCYSCPAATLSCPIGALQAVSGSMKFQFSFYVVGFLLAIGILMGRWVCGWVCPFGLLQELIYRIPTKKFRLWKPFRYGKYIILLVFVILLPITATNFLGMGAPAFCQYICPSGTLFGGIPMFFTHDELRNAVGLLFYWKILLLVVILVGSLFCFRFFCKTICPLGAIYGLLNKISIYHLQVDKSACNHCGACEKVCKMEIYPAKNPRSSECIHCGACVEVCTRCALKNSFGEKIFERKA